MKMTDLDFAKRILKSGDYTCVLHKSGITYTSGERGVKPLVLWYESDISFRDFSAADKVIGKGAAHLYALLGVSSVFADVISAPALDLLESHGIRVEYNTETEHIINRRGDGICPFEAAVSDIDDSNAAYAAIRKQMKEMGIN